MIKALVIGYSSKSRIDERTKKIENEIREAKIKREEIISVTSTVTDYGWHEIVILYEE